MTAVAPDIELIESLDFTPPCRSLYHKDEHPPAEWIIWPARCCDKQPVCNYACDDCLQHVLNSPGGSCRHCGHYFSPMRLYIVRYEPLRGAA